MLDKPVMIVNMKTPRRMILTQANLDKCGWLFSATLQIMVAEHECGGGKWDIEVDAYKKVNETQWTSDPDVYFDSYKTVADVLAKNPTFGKVSDWVHGDDVEMW